MAFREAADAADDEQARERRRIGLMSSRESDTS